MFAGKAGKLLFTRKEPNVGFGILLSLFPVLRSLGEGGKKSEKLFLITCHLPLYGTEPKKKPPQGGWW